MADSNLGKRKSGLSNSSTDNESSRNKFDHLTKKAKKLHAAELKNLNDKLKIKEQNCEKLRKDISNLESQMEEEKEENTKLAAVVESKETAFREKEEAQSKCKKLTVELEAVKEKLNDSESMRKELEKELVIAALKTFGVDLPASYSQALSQCNPQTPSFIGHSSPSQRQSAAIQNQHTFSTTSERSLLTPIQGPIGQNLQPQRFPQRQPQPPDAAQLLQNIRQPGSSIRTAGSNLQMNPSTQLAHTTAPPTCPIANLKP